jgi:hypothetical protein
VTADPPSPAHATAGALEVPAEPIELRSAIASEVLGGADWEERLGPGLGVGEVLWSSWGPVLEQAGLERGRFDALVRGYRRELWLWVLGERLWQQAVSGLAGRALRRLPA